MSNQINQMKSGSQKPGNETGSLIEENTLYSANKLKNKDIPLPGLQRCSKHKFQRTQSEQINTLHVQDGINGKDRVIRLSKEVDSRFHTIDPQQSSDKKFNLGLLERNDQEATNLEIEDYFNKKREYCKVGSQGDMSKDETMVPGDVGMGDDTIPDKVNILQNPQHLNQNRETPNRLLSTENLSWKIPQKNQSKPQKTRKTSKNGFLNPHLAFSFSFQSTPASDTNNSMMSLKKEFSHSEMRKFTKSQISLTFPSSKENEVDQVFSRSGTNIPENIEIHEGDKAEDVHKQVKILLQSSNINGLQRNRDSLRKNRRNSRLSLSRKQSMVSMSNLSSENNNPCDVQEYIPISLNVKPSDDDSNSIGKGVGLRSRDKVLIVNDSEKTEDLIIDEIKTETVTLFGRYTQLLSSNDKTGIITKLATLAIVFMLLEIIKCIFMSLNHEVWQ